MKLLVGLGNPGAEHARQRHNIGFMAIDHIAERQGFGTWRSRFRGLTSEGALDGQRILALKPMTYMNESGRSVAEAARFLKIPPGDIIVLHDELDLAPGRVRVKQGGGVAGHNGLRSIDACLSTRDFARVRLGIGHPGHKDRVLGHVLHDFTKADQTWLAPLLDALADAAPLLLKDDGSAFMSKVALLTDRARDKAPATGRLG